jgi:hypothetical protein
MEKWYQTPETMDEPVIAKEESELREAKTASQEELPDSEELKDVKAGTSGERVRYIELYWTGCYIDSCTIHRSGKDSGYYPRESARR